MTPEPAADGVVVVRRHLDEIVNGGNLELIDELWAEDLSWHGGSMGEVRGIAAYKAMMAGSGFVGLNLVVLDVFTRDDTVVVRFTNSGRRTGRLLGVRYTSRLATWNGVGVFRVADGRIRDAWFVEDLAAMLSQLGPIGAVAMLTSRR